MKIKDIDFTKYYVLVDDENLEIYRDDEKYYICDMCILGRKIFFNIIEEEENIFYAVFEIDSMIEAAMNFNNYHRENYDNNYELKFETENKKLIIGQFCEDCNNIITVNDFIDYNYAICNDCESFYCKYCKEDKIESCDYCGGDYCSNCINWDMELEKNYCDSPSCEQELNEDKNWNLEDDEDEGLF